MKTRLSKEKNHILYACFRITYAKSRYHCHSSLLICIRWQTCLTIKNLRQTTHFFPINWFLFIKTIQQLNNFSVLEVKSLYSVHCMKEIIVIQLFKRYYLVQSDFLRFFLIKLLHGQLVIASTSSEKCRWKYEEVHWKLDISDYYKALSHSNIFATHPIVNFPLLNFWWPDKINWYW